MHEAYSFVIEEAEFQEGSQEAHSKETPPRGHTLKKRDEGRGPEECTAVLSAQVVRHADATC